MPMGNIHDVRWKLNPNHIHARFCGVPKQYRLLYSVPIWNVLPMNIRRRYANEAGIVLCDATYRGNDDTNNNPGRREGANIFCFHGIPLRL
jgi:hypothetical protein